MCGEGCKFCDPSLNYLSLIFIRIFTEGLLETSSNNRKQHRPDGAFKHQFWSGRMQISLITADLYEMS